MEHLHTQVKQFRKNYYNQIIQDHLQKPLPPQLHQPSAKWFNNIISHKYHIIQCFAPTVIVFDPCNQFANDVEHPKCSTCGVMCVTSWSNLKTRDVINDEYTVLIQPCYVCPNNSKHSAGNKHYISPASDRFYLNNDIFPIHIKNQYPVHITHQNAITEGLASLIFGFQHSTLSISKLDQVLRKECFDKIQKKKLNLLITMQQKNIQPQNNWDLWSVKDLIHFKNRRYFFRQSILDDYKQKKEYYIYRMRQKKHNGKIMVDHTHKIAYRCKNAQGQRLYDAVYSVMSREDIMCQRFCVTKEHKEVEDLHQYAERQRHVERVLSDQCCSDRNMVQRIHGADTTCKLDIFHAIQRLTPHMCSTDPLYSIALMEFKDVFYIKNNRVTQKTANISTLQAMYKQWCDKYENHFNNRKLSEAIKKLKVHVDKGCLSDIHPYEKTSCLETMHSHINKTTPGVTKINPELYESIIVPFSANYGKNNDLVKDLSYYEYMEMKMKGTLIEYDYDYPSLFAHSQQTHSISLPHQLQPYNLQLTTITKQSRNICTVMRHLKMPYYQVSFSGPTDWEQLDKIYKKVSLGHDAVSQSLTLSKHTDTLLRTLNQYQLKYDLHENKMNSCISHPYSIIAAVAQNITGNLSSDGTELHKLLLPLMNPCKDYIKQFMANKQMKIYEQQYQSFAAKQRIPPYSLLHYLLPVAISSVTNSIIIIITSENQLAPIVVCDESVKLISNKQYCIILRHCMFGAFFPVINGSIKKGIYRPLAFSKTKSDKVFDVHISSNPLNPINYHHSDYQNSEDFISNNQLKSNINKNYDCNKYWKLLIGFNVTKICMFRNEENEQQLLKQLYNSILWQLRTLNISGSKVDFGKFQKLYHKQRCQTQKVDNFFVQQYNQWLVESSLIKVQIQNSPPFQQHFIALNSRNYSLYSKTNFILNKCFPTIACDQPFECRNCRGTVPRILTDHYFMECCKCSLIYRVCD